MTTKHKNIGLIMTGLLLAILMASMDNTIVATAMGTIVGKMGGLDKFVWVTSAYMITEMAGMPIFGKLSDMYGRKRFFIFGILVFMLGSALCGMANSIITLSLFRAIQGIGAGAMVSIAFAIMFDVVAPENRGKMTGMFGALFGLSSIAAPIIGGYITDHLQWQWIFYINLPLGLIAFVLVLLFYKESAVHAKQSIDYWGAFLLIGAVVCLMLALELGGKQFAWGSSQIIGLFVGFIGFTIALIFVEKRAAEPIISYQMFRNRLYTASNLVAMLSGAAYMSASVFIPIYIQGVLGGSASGAGFVLLPMMVSSVITATLGGFLMTKLSYRTIIASPLVLLIAGLVLLSGLTVETPRFLVTLYMILMGLGIGATFSVLSNSAIHSFSASKRGTASSTLNFNRSLGMTLGITIFGIIQSHALTNKLTSAFAGNTALIPANLNVSDPYVLLNPALSQSLDASVRSTIQIALTSSIGMTFVWSLIPAVLALASALLMRKERLVLSSDDQANYAAAH
ncbi:DHA2 family efflux MFS transporter permease subunit [Paenibacillus albiflavus]|uniref:DHA2 family efflux MFS transporter permease subunit n=1 Tax=Paenibacillus albiflavus TaxID=2545760 RepID=A0A4R4EFB1_9BACL|nr:MDR family MFS transporter [Paenibacillus albiflavus]TCZ78247.1 DHA2 family efflux MFS transporter permease subunit [Paenibacillus albiflavus]